MNKNLLPKTCNLKPITYNLNKGFTFLELIISVAIISVILGAIFTLQDFFFNQQQSTINAYISTDYANRSVEKMVKEIRNSRIANDGAYLFETMNDQMLIFYSNIDKDQEVEKISYYLENNILYKSVINPTGFPIQYLDQNKQISVISENIANGQEPIFYYYNSAWPTDTTNNPLVQNQRARETKLVGISISIKTNDTADTNYQIKSYAQIRTLKDNL